MANSFKVKAQFTAKGNFDKKFSLWERAAARFGKNAEKSFRRAGRSATSFGSITKGVVAGLGISRGLNMLSQGVGSVVTQFIAFDKAALGATVRFTDIGPKAADFNEQLKRIEKSARDAGAATQFTAAQSAEALNFLAKAGFTSTEAMLGLESMINLSIATGEDFNAVADQSSDLLGAFGLAANDAATKIKNLNRLNDVLVKTSNSANVTMETMFDTMKIAAPIGTSLGITLEEMAAVTGVLGAAGIKGSQAATALKNSFLNLTTGKKPVVDMLQAIGAEIKTAKDGSFLFTDTLAEITEKTKNFSKLKRAKVFDQIFGKFAIAGAINLGNAVEKIKDLEKALKAAGGESKLTAEIMGRAIEAKLLVLSSTATEFGFKILEAFRGDAKDGIDSMAESIRNLDVTGFIEELKVMIKFLGLMLTVSSKVAGFINIIGKGLGIAAAQFVLGREDVSPLDVLKGGGQQIKPKIGRAERFASSFDEFGGGELDVESPNKGIATAKAQQQQATLRAQLNINAPAGTTMDIEQPAVGFSAELLGQN